MSKVDNKVALITGANGGLGVSLVREYLANDYTVVAHCRNKTNELHDLHEQFDNFLFHVYSDLNDTDAIKCTIVEINKLVGGVDVLVNNAGTFTEPVDFFELTTDHFINVLRVNLLAAFEFSKYFIQGMLERKYGRIVNVSSISVEHGGSPSTVNYTCSKAALEALGASYAKLGPDKNVLVNSIRVGLTDTKFHEKNPTKDMTKRIQLVPMKRMAEPSEIAKTIFYFGSENNSFTTGTVIKVSGGE